MTNSVVHNHLDQTLTEATDLLKGSYPADIRDYDAAVVHILRMADILSDGIIAQFPQKFDARRKTASR